MFVLVSLPKTINIYLLLTKYGIVQCSMLSYIITFYCGLASLCYRVYWYLLNYTDIYWYLLNYTVIYWTVLIFVTGPARIDHMSTKNHGFLLSLLYHNLITIYSYHNKIFITTAEFNRLSSEAYKNEILHSKRKILTKI